MKSHSLVLPIIMALILMLFFAPSSAGNQITTYKGAVTAVDADRGIITINATHYYNCSYTNVIPCTWDPAHLQVLSDPGRICEWSQLDEPQSISGNVATKAVLTETKSGSLVYASTYSSTGTKPGGAWIAIDHIASEVHPGVYISETYGEPDVPPMGTYWGRFNGDYEVSYKTLPDCQTCNGTVCAAKSADISVHKYYYGEVVNGTSLKPGESYSYTDKDGSSLNILFEKGQASAFLGCKNSSEEPEQDPISVFVVRASESETKNTIPSRTTSSEVNKTPISTLAVMTALAFAGLLFKKSQGKN